MARIVKYKKRRGIIKSVTAFMLAFLLIFGTIACAHKDETEPPENPPQITEPEEPEDPDLPWEDPEEEPAIDESIFSDKPTSKENLLLGRLDESDLPDNVYNKEYSNTTAVGFYGEVTGAYQRVKPIAETRNEASAFSDELADTVFAGKARYPKYGSTLKHVIGSGDAQVAARGALVQETAYLCAWGTRGANRGGEQTPDKYTKIDKDGYLYQYKNNEWIHSLVKGVAGTEADYNNSANYRRLYKHTAANGMYLEGYTKNGVTYAVDDQAKAVVKNVTMRSRGYSSYGITGLYAPAGEVIKIELSGADMNATGGITVYIGQALYNGQANNIWVGKNAMNRPPLILTTLVLNKNTCTYDSNNDTWTGYVGSFLGGPIYIANTSKTYTAKISGGLEYLHFVLGYTTEEEFTRLKRESKVPYFDLEVWNYGVLHSGPRYYAEGFSYDNLYKAAVLWEKVSSVTASSSKLGIVFIYDPFVAAGAAVAFPGRNSVNCPTGWMGQSLNYNTLVNSGSWGNFHEYHHNFQNYGLGSGADGETTNNGLTLVSYALFTKISSKRGMGSFGSQGLGGWNNYTSAPFALQRVKTGQTASTNGLAIYATLLHNFGAAAYTSARGARGKNAYLNKWATVTHNDFSYFASLMGTTFSSGDYTPSDDVKNAKYPMFVPVASVYQTGRSYMYDGEKKYFKTMQPYLIANNPFNIDLRPYTAPNGQYSYGSVVIPDGFTYKVKKVTNPKNGSIEVIDDFNFKYTPADGAKTGSTSGPIVATLEITKTDGAFKVDDVDIVLEFQITQETTKMQITRTTYTYNASSMYKDAVTAYDSGFSGSTNGGLKQAQFNPTQNANTDIWFYPDTEANRKKYPDAPDKYFFHDNTVEVLDGKLFFDEDGIYRVYLRGRDNCALYYSANGRNYTLGARITKTTPITNYQNKNNTALFRPGASETYFDVKFDEGKVYVKSGAAEEFSDTPVYTITPAATGEIDNWLYIKEVLIVDSAAGSFIGVGMRQWTDPMFTQKVRYYSDAAYRNEISEADYNAMSDEDKDKVYTKSYYINGAGQEVSEDVVLAAKSTPPTVANINGSQPYVNAYRTDYDFPDNSSFESDYFYIRTYNYNYSAEPVVYSTWDKGVRIVSCNKNPAGDAYVIGNILKSGNDTYFHSDNAGKYDAGGPMVLVLDMGKVIKANSVTFLGRTGAATTAQQAIPKEFSLEVSVAGKAYSSAGEYTNTKVQSDRQLTVELNKDYEFRYVKITIKSTYSNNKHFILSGIKFTYTFALTGNGANHISPDNDALVFGGEWQAEQGVSTFGQIYHGKKGSSIHFVMNGTRLAVLTATLRDSRFEVWIDGSKVESIAVDPPTGGTGVAYISQPLSNEQHKVEIRCTGDMYFDSIALY